MTVEEIRGNLGDSTDNFPVGMHVLAVDDDPTYLRKLDCLLRRCQYQVTTTSQSRTALKMLRENQNRFDLIITNVHMPDMDGFKLLELVSLEMDLPVIMLSANNDPKLVMKGITHGACDYLVKPVRLEVLSNIWQHVIRRKKFDHKSQNNSTAQEGSEGGEGPIKDDEEDRDDNGNGNEDSGTQKMPRFVWSIELHRKFVAAVDQLGIEKALPKRILDMMNVEGLTRENVASHLQKYRLYLNKIRKDASYLRMGSLDGLGDVRTFAASARLPNTTLSPYIPLGMLGRFNSPAGMNLRNLSSLAQIQTSHPQNSSHSVIPLGKCQPVVSPANQSASLFQGLGPLNQLQQSKFTTRVGEFSSIDYPRLFTAGSTCKDTRVTVGSSSNSLASAQSNPLVLQGNQQQTQSGRGFTNQSSLEVASLNSESFNIAASGSSVDDSIGNIDQNGKLSRKKKDDEEDGDDNGNENEDSGTRSRPPVVWSIELHRKFVAAISQLGIEKALPERILDMMNVEGLTRENVASHLQKYRLHLKSIRSVASQQANMVAVLGGTNASYLRMGSPYRFGDFRKFASASHLPNTALSPYPPSGMLGRLDSPAGMNLRNFSSSALVQTSHPQNSNNSLNALAKFQPVVSPANQSASLFQGLGPLNQLQQSQSMSRIGEFSSIDYPRLFTAGTTFTDTRVTVGSSSNSLASAPSNPLMLQGNQQQTQSGRGFTNQSSLNSESRCNENWNNTIHFSKFPLNTLPLSEPVNHDQFPQYNNNSTRHIQNNPVHDSECREGLVGDIVQNMNQTQNQMCGLQQQDYSQYSNNSFGNLIRNVDQNNAFYNRRMGVSLVGQSNTGALTPLQHSKIEIKSNEGFLSEQTKPLGGLVPRCYDSLDDLMHPLMKREKDGTMLTDGEFGFDAYSFGSCICLQILVGLGLLLLLGLLVSCLLEEL